MGDPSKCPHSGPPCHSFQIYVSVFCTCLCLCVFLHASRHNPTRNGKTFFSELTNTDRSWRRQTLCLESIPSCERLSFCGPHSRKGLVWHAWRSCLFRILHLSYHLFFSASMQMDNKGWNGQKASFTEATSNSEYQHVSLCSFSISFPFSLLLPIFPLYTAGGFSHRDGPAFNLCDWSMGLWLSA